MGGVVKKTDELLDEVNVTKGMAHSMKSDRKCSNPECTIVMPKYKGRYPNNCPECGHPIELCSPEGGTSGES